VAASKQNHHLYATEVIAKFVNSAQKMTKKTTKKTKINFSNLLALTPFFRPYLREIIFALVALILTSLTILFFGEIIKYLIDYGFVQKNEQFLNFTLLTFCGVTLIMAFAGYYRSSLINSVTEKAISDLRKKAYNHVITISAEFFEVFKSGDVISRLTVDTVTLYQIISNSISFLLRNLMLFIGGIGFLFFTSFKLTLISLFLIPIAIAPIIIMGRKIKNLSTQSQQAIASVTSHIEETINGIKTIQSYLCEAKESNNFSYFVDLSLKAALQKIALRALLVAFVIAFAFSGIAVVLWFGGHQVLSGKMTSGDLSSFIFYSVISATSLVAISQISGQLQSASAAAERVLDLLKIDSPVKEAEKTIPFLTQEKITINFNQVSFAYPSRGDSAILNNFNLEIKPQEKIAIVGASGSGKSTILQLLLRFYDVSSGSISINGYGIKSLSFADLRKNFAYISQDCFIFSGSVFENITYVNREVRESEVERVIEENEALHFIKYLPQKTHTFVGEKGIQLSGGEKQRIAIARAIIKNSPILLLDEATSALDNYNAAIIDQAIAKIAKDKTVITIAHKLSSISSSDRIIFIQNGEIAEIGNHQELLIKNGLYKKMYEAELADSLKI